MSLILRPLTIADEAAVRDAHAELAAEGFAFALFLDDHRSWPDYLAHLETLRRGDGLPADRVPMTFLVAEADGVIVGRTSVRHQLNDWLRARGGHIGYAVLPAARRRGHAREILRQSLVLARAHGVREALLTVEDGNEGSIRTIESCGGRVDPAWPSDTLDGEMVRRYWVGVA